ncbi:MAG: hypothetical protein LE180_01425, partial [Endomicrobium sp.]|uniref:hypothetical protein n=1 Tax=Candidatus Endomicrobiellum pyrsonymphae TaxID=1408203 RepID=UPI00357218C5|nr:hypothetical protein [Endomicrobium sp.]
QMTKQTDLLKTQLLRRHLELSPQTWNQIKQGLPADDVIRMEAEQQVNEQKCIEKANDILDSSSFEQAESLIHSNMRADERRALERQLNERKQQQEQQQQQQQLLKQRKEEATNKYYSETPLILITVPPPQSPNIPLMEKIKALDIPSIEQANALEEVQATIKEIIRMSKELGAKNERLLANHTTIGIIKKWSRDISQTFDSRANQAYNVIEEEWIKPEKDIMEKVWMTTLYKSTSERSNKQIEKAIREATLAKKAEETLPPNLKDMVKKYVSAKMKATRLLALRNIGYDWDKEGIRLEPETRKLKIHEMIALRMIMFDLEKRELNNKVEIIVEEVS